MRRERDGSSSPGNLAGAPSNSMSAKRCTMPSIGPAPTRWKMLLTRATISAMRTAWGCSHCRLQRGRPLELNRILGRPRTRSERVDRQTEVSGEPRRTRDWATSCRGRRDLGDTNEPVTIPANPWLCIPRHTRRGEGRCRQRPRLPGPHQLRECAGAVTLIRVRIRQSSTWWFTRPEHLESDRALSSVCRSATCDLWLDHRNERPCNSRRPRSARRVAFDPREPRGGSGPPSCPAGLRHEPHPAP